ncbi:MAG: hypothetical protein ACOYN6_06595 [Ignavibacteria bacterium]
MENIELQGILLKTAVLAMASDGVVHEEELKEISKLAEAQNYFSDLNYNTEVKELVYSVNNDYRKTYADYFEIFENNYLSIVEILLIFEVLLKIVNADMKIADEERNFIKFLRKKFTYVPNDIFLARFGNNELFNIENDIASFESKKIDLNNINLNDYLGNDIK